MDTDSDSSMTFRGRHWPENTGHLRRDTIWARIEDRISQLYYRHGLFCSSHPWTTLFITLIVFAVASYPLMYVHIIHGSSSGKQQFISRLDPSANVQTVQTDQPLPRWLQASRPVAYVQQIVVKAAVVPWQSNLILMDAIRGPLAEVFAMQEFISNFQLDQGDGRPMKTLSEICFQVSEPIIPALPRYSCLQLSPAYIWQNDMTTFLQDATLIKTLYSIKDFATPDSSGSVREILFGVPWMETGIRRLYVRTRQRTITFAITLVLKRYDAEFIASLTQALRNRYPTSPFKTIENDTMAYSDAATSQSPIELLNSKNVTHMLFSDDRDLTNLLPLLAAYVLLFLFVYFSIRKVDLIKNKWALAGGAVVTVILSLLMSIGVCLWWDFNPTLNRSDILPYLVLIIGLENIFVLTKSVISTAAHLDKRVRVAQGLSKEGFNITKNLILELILLLCGLCTFVPIIQEVCLFGIVGLLSDHFLQLSFFATILSIDLQRTELEYTQYGRKCTAQMAMAAGHGGMNIFARAPSKPIQFKLPKRLRVVYFWARTRLVQRSLMVCLVVWISYLVYKTGPVDILPTSAMLQQAAQARLAPNLKTVNSAHNEANQQATHNDSIKATGYSSINSNGPKQYTAPPDILNFDRNSRYWRQLGASHWRALFGCYNASVSGKYISILAPIQLAIPIEPATAIARRHPAESDPQIIRHLFSGPAGNPSDLLDESDDELRFSHSNEHWTTGELVALAAVSFPTIMFISYIFYTLYKCCCSRHYAEWRTSWSETLQGKKRDSHRTRSRSRLRVPMNYEQFVLEALPVKLSGHDEEIELIAAGEESPFVASICMKGDILVWDVLSGECNTHIKRAKHWRVCQSAAHTFKPAHKPSGSFSSDSTYGSSPGNCSLSGDLAAESPGPMHHQRTSSNSFENRSAADSSDAPLVSSRESFTMKHRRQRSLPNPIPNNSSASNLLSQLNSSSNVHDKGSAGKAYNFGPFASKINANGTVINELIRSALADRGEESQSYSSQRVHANYAVDSSLPFKAVWASDICERWLWLGAENGRIEVWDVINAKLVYWNESTNSGYSGVSTLRVTSNRAIVAYMNGVLEFYSILNENERVAIELLQALRAHQQPISALTLDYTHTHAVTGSLDHQLKVFRIDNCATVYTLRGHHGAITVLESDPSLPSTAISGCSIGLVMVWDLGTGACVFSLEAHQGASITALHATPLYVLSAATDNKICVWDKYSGNLINTITQHHSLAKQIVNIAPNLLVTAKEDQLVIWDISEAVPLRVISLGSQSNNGRGAFIRNVHVASSNRVLVCDSGPTFCIVHFPGSLEKFE